MSDGEDTVNSSENMENMFQMYNKYVSGSGMQAIFKVVGIGKDSDVEIGFQLEKYFFLTLKKKVWKQKQRCIRFLRLNRRLYIMQEGRKSNG